MIFCGDDKFFGMPYALLIGILISFTALIPNFWSIYRMCNRSTFDLYGESDAGIDLRGNVPCITADRRKFDLSACRWKFCGAAVYLGACCSQYWSELDGHCRNVEFLFRLLRWFIHCFVELYIGD